jgi:hypothetical protein
MRYRYKISPSKICMKLPVKILFINIALALVCSLLLTFIFSGGGITFMMIPVYTGLVGLFGGLIDLIIGLFLLIKTDKRYAQGFFLSGGVLMLIGFAACLPSWY